MNKKEKSIFIKIIEYGIKKDLKGVTFPEIKEFLLKEGVDMADKTNFLQEAFSEIFLNDQQRRYGITFSQTYYLTAESYFRFLEYKELQEARETAKRAHLLAIIAIAISGFLALFSIGIQVYQIYHPCCITTGNNQEILNSLAK